MSGRMWRKGVASEDNYRERVTVIEGRCPERVSLGRGYLIKNVQLSAGDLFV